MSFLGNKWPENREGGFVAAAIITAVAAVAGAAEQAKASSDQARTASQVADYNAKLDAANAQQTAMNAQANIQKQRQDDKAFQSSQRAALAASGVLSSSGSPMALQATTAGRQEQDIQQYWQSTQLQETKDYESAQLGVYEGQQESEAYHLQGAAEIFAGIGGAAGSISKAATGIQTNQVAGDAWYS